MLAWLEQEGLGALSTLANEKRLEGSILLALYDARTDTAAYKYDCSDLGIPTGAIQLKLKGKLVALFD